MTSENGTFLSRDAILKVPLKTDEVPVPEWGGRVCIRELGATERDEFEAFFSTVKRKIKVGGQKGGDAPEADIEIHSEKIRVRLCQLSMIDESGNQMFPDEKDLEVLGRTSSRALQRVFQASWKLSGFGTEGIEAEGKGSEPDQVEDSPSELPAT